MLSTNCRGVGSGLAVSLFGEVQVIRARPLVGGVSWAFFARWQAEVKVNRRGWQASEVCQGKLVQNEDVWNLEMGES